MTGKMYGKKPVVIEAMQMNGQTVEIAKWLNEHGCKFSASTHPTDASQDTLTIHTLEGAMEASPGDWIIRGVKGEFYPCKPDVFDFTYEEYVGTELIQE